MNIKRLQRYCMQPSENKGLTRSWDDIVGFGNHHRVRRWEKQKDNKHPNDENPGGSLGIHFGYGEERMKICGFARPSTWE